ncbi:hypothetical protein FNF07_06110 [Trinickia caryophylli]|nr:hypothetical protein C0Z17_00970 [Trinickia caryophylli]TRX17841.1 hypothetical protein FNF07_06110 [Trinickia caryophylli]
MQGGAQHRADRARLKKKRRSWWAGQPPKTEVQLGRLIDTPTPCSCWMCGNPRRYLGERTIGERRWAQYVDDDGK